MNAIAKQTKIVCTLGPASNTSLRINQLVRAGMNVARLNFSHGTHREHAALIRLVRTAAKETGESVTVLQDLSGPKMRVGDLPQEGVLLKKDSEIAVEYGSAYKKDAIPLNYPHLHRDIRPGEQILLDDGLMELRALRVSGKRLFCKVVVGGTLLSHKGFNVPHSKLRIDAITAKDREDVAFGVQKGVDWITLSFVRNADDIENLRSLIRRHGKKGRLPLVMAKIEKKEALDDLENIVRAVDGIMIARGDLAIETPAEELPVRQKEIIDWCLRYQKPVIVATEMMASMAKNPRPTRAELSDVGHAVMDHADAVMTSGESATGKYPAATVTLMGKIAQSTEKSIFDDYPLALHAKHGHTRERIAGTAARMLEAHTGAQALLFVRGQEYLGRLCSHYRVQIPLVIGVKDERSAARLNLWWGVHGVPVSGSVQEQKKTLLRWLREKGIRRGKIAAFMSSGYPLDDELFSLEIEEKAL